MKQQRKKVRIITLAGFAIFFRNTSQFQVLIWNNTAFSTLSQFDANAVVEYLRDLGTMGCSCISYSYVVLQSVAAHLSAFLITLSNAAIFGWSYWSYCFHGHLQWLGCLMFLHSSWIRSRCC